MPVSRVTSLIFDFRFQGVRCRKQTLLDDTPANRRRLEKVLQRIELEIHQGVFDYSAFFPGSKLAQRSLSRDVRHLGRLTLISLC